MRGPGAGPDAGGADSRHDDTSAHGAVFWAAVVVGGTLMAWGVAGFLDAVSDTSRRTNLALWLVGADIAHDVVVAPLALAAGWLVTRAAPRWVRPPLQAGLFASAIVLVLAWLPLHGTADAARNPTIQPLDYGTATAWALLVVWAPVIAWAGWRRRAGTPPADPPDDR